MRRILMIASLAAVPAGLFAGSLTIPHAFSNNTVADAAQVNANMAAVATAVNDNHARLGTLEGRGQWTKTGNDIAYTAGKVTAGGSLSTQGGAVQRDVFTYNSGDNNAVPLHLKTTWRTNNGAMYRIHLEGYNYGAAKAIDSDCVGYLYSATDLIQNAACTNYAGGITLSQYKSSDGYLVLRLDYPTAYYIGFTTSVMTLNPTGAFSTTFTPYRQSANL